MRNLLIIGVIVVVGAGAWYFTQQGGEMGGGADIMMDADDIAGVVTGPNGPEAGAWVIAETDDLPTKFIRTVITDDEGRYLIPDLPDANFQVWARAYGNSDSAATIATPGSQVDLEQVVCHCHRRCSPGGIHGFCRPPRLA